MHRSKETFSSQTTLVPALRRRDRPNKAVSEPEQSSCHLFHPEPLPPIRPRILPCPSSSLRPSRHGASSSEGLLRSYVVRFKIPLAGHAPFVFPPKLLSHPHIAPNTPAFLSSRDSQILTASSSLYSVLLCGQTTPPLLRSTITRRRRPRLTTPELPPPPHRPPTTSLPIPQQRPDRPRQASLHRARRLFRHRPKRRRLRG